MASTRWIKRPPQMVLDDLRFEQLAGHSHLPAIRDWGWREVKNGVPGRPAELNRRHMHPERSVLELAVFNAERGDEVKLDRDGLLDTTDRAEPINHQHCADQHIYEHGEVALPKIKTNEQPTARHDEDSHALGRDVGDLPHVTTGDEVITLHSLRLAQLSLQDQLNTDSGCTMGTHCSPAAFTGMSCNE